VQLENPGRNGGHRNVQLDVAVGRQPHGVGRRAVGGDVVETLDADGGNQRIGEDVLGGADGRFGLDAELGRSRGNDRAEALQHAVPDDRAGGQFDAQVVPADPAAVVGEGPADDDIAVGFPFSVVGVVNPGAAGFLNVTAGAVVAGRRQKVGRLDALVDAV